MNDVTQSDKEQAMEQNKSAEVQRCEWRERKQRSRANIAAKEEENELRELANELKKAIRESPDRAVPRSFFAEYGVTATMEAMRFLKIGPVSDVPAAGERPAYPQSSPWWIGKSTQEILARLAETNQQLVERLFSNHKPTLELQAEGES